MLALRDAAPRLRRMAWEFVRRQRAYIPFAQVHAILTARRDYQRLVQFAQTDQWLWLETLVELASDPACDPATKVMLQKSALDWHRAAGRHYSAPGSRLTALFALPASQRALAVLSIPALWLRPL